MTPLGQKKGPDRFLWGLRISRKALWGVLLLSCFLLAGIGRLNRAWQVNLVSLKVLRGVDNQCEESKPAEWVLCAASSEQGFKSLLVQDGTDCQLLWLSRVQASESLTLAQETFSQSSGCPRRELVSAWGGQLAWLRNDTQAARRWWQKLSPAQTMNWGYLLLIRNRTEEAEFLLNLSLEEGGLSLSQSQRAQVLSNLGLEARLSEEWPQAITYYQDALELAPEDASIYLRLGLSYRQNGQPREAVRILELGLEYLPLTYYEFVSDYQVQLGQAYRESGNRQKALEAFQQAQAWLGKVDPPNPDKVRLIDGLLDQSLKSWEGNP